VTAVEERLHATYDVTIAPAGRTSNPQTLSEALATYDALCSSITDRLDANVLGSPGIVTKIIANFGAGIEHIDLAAAKRAGVVVTNTPDALTDTTAELTILLMLMASRRAGEGERRLRAGKWLGWTPTDTLGHSVAGKTLGLVGFGRIARETARRARIAFGMRIAYHSRSRAAADDEAKFEAQYFPTLEALLENADVVSLHTPGGEATRHMIDARRLALLKPSAILINTSRGSVVDEGALAAALQEHRILAAGLDVYEREPMVHPQLLGLENAVLLPHLGSATVETRTAMGMQMVDNLDAYFDGRPPPNRVA
jgi:lactate dehydrogenase-like 2-hydroxyacid dehydrogenase